jgi:hypothetical protein
MMSPERQPAEEDERARRARERVGRVLHDRWRLDELLCVGDEAAVYAGTHRMGKRIAVKILHLELSQSSEAKQRFIDEGHAANRIGHPGVPSISDDGDTEDGAVFLVMDLLEGEPLLSPPSVRKHSQRALALGGALLIASIAWGVGRMHQAVLVSAAASADRIGCPFVQNVASVDQADPFLALERERSESDPLSAKKPVDVARGARTHRGKLNRSFPKATARPVEEEGVAASTPSTTPPDLVALSMSPPTSIDLTRRSPFLPDLLDRRK